MPLMLTNFFYHKQAKTRSRPAVWSCKCLLKGKVPFVQSSGAATLTAFYVILIRPNRFIRIRFKTKRLMFVELQWSFIWSSRSRWCPDVFTFHQFRFKLCFLIWQIFLFRLIKTEGDLDWKYESVSAKTLAVLNVCHQIGFKWSE